jgi:sarcosine oxidase
MVQRGSDFAYDHIVVGAGAMGSATAWQLAKRGRSVLLIEQFSDNHVSGSSHGGTRIFRLGHQQQIYTELGISALQLWRELEAESDTSLVELIGHVDHGPPEVVNEIEEILDSHDLVTTRLSPQAARDRWPGMIFDGSVIFSPDGGRVFAQRTVDALWQRILVLGGEILTETKVLSIDIEADVAIVETQDETYRTKSVVIAAGAWVPGLVGQQVAMRPLTPMRAQPTHFAPRPECDDIDLWPTFIHRGRSARSAQRENDTMWYGLWTPGEGVKVAPHNVLDQLDLDLDNRSFEINMQREFETVQYVAEWLPGLDPTSANSTTCLYTNEPNENFILDRHGPLTVCSPCSGQGFKYVPAVGAITADLAMGGTQAVKQWQFAG